MKKSIYRLFISNYCFIFYRLHEAATSTDKKIIEEARIFFVLFFYLDLNAKGKSPFLFLVA